MDGTRLWRIDLGPNVRSGAATTNFLVFDFDGDGCAEICCKTGDGTVDGLGHRIGDAQADWRTWDKKSPTYGKIVNGPEYLTVFEGRTGKELDSKEYILTRYPSPSKSKTKKLVVAAPERTFGPKSIRHNLLPSILYASK